MIFKLKETNLVYECVQYTGHNGAILKQWSKGRVIESPVCEPTFDNPTGAYVQIYNTKFDATAKVGDWIIYDWDVYVQVSNDYFKKNFVLVPTTHSFSSRYGASKYFNDKLFNQDRFDYKKAAKLYLEYNNRMSGLKDEYFIRLVYEDFIKRIKITKWHDKATCDHLLNIFYAIYHENLKYLAYHKKNEIIRSLQNKTDKL